MSNPKLATKVRKLLEARLARRLETDASEVSGFHFRIGSIVHLLFLLDGDSEGMPGIGASMSALNQLLGANVVWVEAENAKSEEDEAEKETVN